VSEARTCKYCFQEEGGAAEHCPAVDSRADKRGHRWEGEAPRCEHERSPFAIYVWSDGPSKGRCVDCFGHLDDTLTLPKDPRPTETRAPKKGKVLLSAMSLEIVNLQNAIKHAREADKRAPDSIGRCELCDNDRPIARMRCADCEARYGIHSLDRTHPGS
jgi:hypothetical protein